MGRSSYPSKRRYDHALPPLKELDAVAQVCPADAEVAATASPACREGSLWKGQITLCCRRRGAERSINSDLACFKATPSLGMDFLHPSQEPHRSSPRTAPPTDRTSGVEHVRRSRRVPVRPHCYLRPDLTASSGLSSLLCCQGKSLR